ncbi:MAG: hypothetical protein ACI8RD_013295 [Bacillariaceae sp.]|jgi:hypothetical protein
MYHFRQYFYAVFFITHHDTNMRKNYVNTVDFNVVEY